MKRNIYLEGDLGGQFGTVHSTVATTVQEALKCIEVNYPLLRKYLIDAAEEGTEFSVLVEGEVVEDAEDLLLPLKEGDITISPVIAGAKSGGAKVLTAMAMFAVLLIPGGAGVLGIANGSSQSIFAASQALGAVVGGGIGNTLAGMAGMMAMSIATNLALSGIAQMMAPDPSVDKEQEEGYLYQGSTSNIIEGDPVPLLYGELRIPGQPISIAVKSVSNSENYINGPEEADHLQLGENSEWH